MNKKVRKIFAILALSAMVISVITMIISPFL